MIEVRLDNEILDRIVEIEKCRERFGGVKLPVGISSKLRKNSKKKSSDDHPILKAAVVHYQLVTIHPFEDGNGRTARLMSDYVLDRSRRLRRLKWPRR